MKSIFTLLFISAFLFSKGQTIKIKSSTFTHQAGEDIIAFEVSDTVPPSPGFGGGSGSSLPKFEFLKIKKLRDSSTNELWKRSVNGARIPEVTFEFYNESQVATFKIIIKDVSVNHFSYLTPECTGCMKLMHQVWFDYKQIESYDLITGTSVKFNRATNVLY